MVVKSADRAFQILEAVGSRSNGVTHGELSKILGIPKGSLSYLLSNLVDRDYVTFDRQSKLYRLGPKLLVLTGLYLSNLDFVRVGRPVLRQLVADINEDAELAIMKDEEILFLYKEECSQPLKFSIAIGERAPIYATSAGKAILAFLPGDEVSKYLSSVKLDPITYSTITDVEALRSELEDIRSQGLAYGREEFHQGISAIAAPVFNLYGDVVGSAVVTLPSIRFNTEQKQSIEAKLLMAAREISRQLGFDPGIVGVGNNGEGEVTRASCTK
jgi:IclR family transcriptional regulator, KDG regulon repressor